MTRPSASRRTSGTSRPIGTEPQQLGCEPVHHVRAVHRGAGAAAAAGAGHQGRLEILRAADPGGRDRPPMVTPLPVAVDSQGGRQCPPVSRSDAHDCHCIRPCDLDRGVRGRAHPGARQGAALRRGRGGRDRAAGSRPRKPRRPLSARPRPAPAHPDRGRARDARVSSSGSIPATAACIRSAAIATWR